MPVRKGLGEDHRIRVERGRDQLQKLQGLTRSMSSSNPVAPERSPRFGLPVLLLRIDTLVESEERARDPLLMAMLRKKWF